MIKKRWGAYAKNPVRYYCPPWERNVDVCFVTESKVPTWNPLLDPGPIKKKSKPGPGNHSHSKKYGNDYFTGPGQTVTENTDGDDSRVIMDRVLPFIQQATEKERPFLSVIWFHTPHSPVVGGEKYRRMYAEHPEPHQHYYACLSAMDEQIGRLRTELERLGISENTMLWFCSDNGAARQGSPRHVGSTGGLSGYKLSIREGGIRVPGLLLWPEFVPQPMRIDAPCMTSDYVPTILDALQIPLPENRDYDGISLLPLLRGTESERKSPLGFLNKEGREAAWMEDQYKLIVTKNRTELYDIVSDPGEKTGPECDFARCCPADATRFTELENGCVCRMETSG